MYSDRVRCYHLLVKLDPVLFTNKYTEVLPQFIALDENHALAQAELNAFNSSGQFIYKHSITIQYLNEREMVQVKQLKPEQLVDKIVNTKNNITRYESLIRNEKYKNKDQLSDWQNIIARDRKLLEAMKLLISS